MKRTYTADEKAHALELYAEHGAAEAGAILGINPNTIRSWASREGAATLRREATEAAVAAHVLSAEERKATLAAKLLTLADIAVDVELDKLRKSDLRDVVGSRTRAIHDVQLLTGQATSRTETIHAATVDDEIARLTAELAGNDPTPEAAPVGPA